MSGALTALGLGSNFLSSSSFSSISSALSGTSVGSLMALIRQQRSIGTIIPDVTIEENFEDRLQVTIHPVATGTPISDHAFRLPRNVVMKVGFTNANPIGAAVGGLVSSLSSGASIGDSLSSAGSGLLNSFTEQRAKQVYDKLLSLQFNDKASDTTLAVVPFKLTAGKRTYDNMVITELRATNTKETEYALIIEVRMQEVITISTSTTPSQSNQSSPSQTDGASNTGTQQPQQAGPESTQLQQELGPVFNSPGYVKPSQ